MHRITILVTIFLIVLIKAGGQENYVINGSVTDATTGEALPGTSIVVENLPATGTSSNNYGFYSLQLHEGEYTIHFRYIGYEPEILKINLNEDTKLDIQIKQASYKLGNIEVTGRQADNNIRSVEMGSIKMTPRQLESIPVIFGEADILKTIQLLPGVKSSGEGNSGFHVRGGGIDQNLILLDEAPVYSSAHLLGFFSVFNSDAIKNATLLKGFVPAEYGGRASSVFDIQMKEGNMKRYGLTGNIGLISSNLTIEGPLVDEKSSFMVSGRRTYADLFLNLSSDDDVRNSYLYFYDINLKTNFKVNDKNRIYLSGYLGRDDFGYKDEFGFDWGSITGTLRWNHIFNQRLFSNTSLIFSNYSYNINVQGNLDFHIKSEIKDINLKQDFSFYASPSHTIKFGANIIHHNILPGEITVRQSLESFIPPDNIARRNAIEWSAYLADNHRVVDKLTLYYGIRASFFSNVGDGEYYEFDNSGNLLSTYNAEEGEVYTTQGGLEPRLAITYLLNERSSVKAIYTRMNQYLHLLTNTTTTTPTDLWLPSSNNVKPQISEQVSLGYFRNFLQNQYEFSIETYYKDLKNQIDYKNGAELLFNSTVESELVFGRGWAYGAELLFRKNAGRFNGWLGYTLSKTMRHFKEINNGIAFPSRHDRTHDLSLVAMYALSKKLRFSATWTFYTGNAVTFPSGRYEIDGKPIPYYTERNGYRMPDYHRLDLGLVWQVKKTDKFESSWNISVYNAYARENAYFIDFRPKENNATETEAVQISLFKAIPSISYRFRF